MVTDDEIKRVEEYQKIKEKIEDLKYDRLHILTDGIRLNQAWGMGFRSNVGFERILILYLSRLISKEKKKLKELKNGK